MHSLLIIDHTTFKKELENVYNQNKLLHSFLTSSDDYIEYVQGHQPQNVILEETYEFVSSFFLVLQIIKKSTNLNMNIYIVSDTPDEKLIEQVVNLKNDRVKIIKKEAFKDLLVSSTTENPSIKPVVNNKIVYISENKFMHFVIKDALKSHAITLIECLSVKEGIEKSELFLPDLIITDLELTKVSGFDVCKSVKNNSTIAHIPVVIYSSNSDEDCIEKAFEVGAKSYIVKKFHHENLAHKILKALK